MSEFHYQSPSVCLTSPSLVFLTLVRLNYPVSNIVQCSLLEILDEKRKQKKRGVEVFYIYIFPSPLHIHSLTKCHTLFFYITCVYMYKPYFCPVNTSLP